MVAGFLDAMLHVDVEVVADELVLSGGEGAARDEAGGRAQRTGRFRYRVSLPTDVNADDIEPKRENHSPSACEDEQARPREG